ncbi:MAG: stage 0 sporulation family protein [Desulfuromonadaceae bacterium]|nr:stage 0 sporulation family protein [Desulfuromonadaceae bacterium]
MSRIVTIQFVRAGKMYDFEAGLLELVQGDHVIVETERGLGIGQVIRQPAERESGASGSLLAIKRKATDDDMATMKMISQKEKEAFNFCVKRIVERNMPMKLVRAEYQFDSSKAVFFFTADGRVDFRDLVKDLAHAFHTRIEMRQIGVRDESKMIGGIGICGRELCCCSFLRDFQPVSVKMAKEQNLALNPNKISGQCGRLLCCLDYEYETYCSLRKNFPKAGKRVRTVNAVGVTDKVNILTGNITLKLDDNKIIVIRREDIIGEGTPAPLASTQPAETQAPARVGQRDQDKRSDQRRGLEKRAGHPITSPTPSETATPLLPAAIITTEAPAEQDAEKTAKGRKKHRSRKHGHRKPQGNKPGSGTPSPSLVS